MQFYRDIDPVDDRDREQQLADEHARRDAALYRARRRAEAEDDGIFDDDY